jgi:hypothetical protein
MNGGGEPVCSPRILAVALRMNIDKFHIFRMALPYAIDVALSGRNTNNKKAASAAFLVV